MTAGEDLKIMVFEPGDGPGDEPSERGTRLPRGLSGDVMAPLR